MGRKRLGSTFESKRSCSQIWGGTILSGTLQGSFFKIGEHFLAISLAVAIMASSRTWHGCLAT